MDIKSEIIKTTIKKTIVDNEFFHEELKNINLFNGPKYPIVDAHIHLVDFNQETLWIKTLLDYMDRTNIIASVIFGLSVVKIWWENEKDKPNYYLDDDNRCYYYWNTDVIVAREYLSLSKKDRKRFFPLLCWFNALDINSVNHIIDTYKSFPWVFCWIWEVFFRHDDLTHLTYWEPPRMNTKASKKLFEFASVYDLPVMVHSNITAPWVSDYPKFLPEIETTLREYPKAKVILAYCWASRRLNTPYYTKLIERLLSEYPCLYVDYSWVVFDEIITANNTSFNEWVELTEKFPDRIMIWSDVLGKWFADIWYINSRYNKFLDALTENTRNKVCRENAIKLFSKSKNRVEKWLKRKIYSLKDIKKDEI